MRGAGRSGIEGVLDQDRDTLRDGGSNRRGVKDLGAEVRQLHRLFVGHLRQHEGGRHDAGIGAEHAVDVGPDLDRRRAERGPDDRGAIVGAVAADGRRLAVGGGADEAGDDRHESRRTPQQTRKIGARSSVRCRELDVGVGEVIVGHEQVTRVDECRSVASVEIGGHDER